MPLRLNAALAVILVCLGAVASARAVDEDVNAYVNGNFEAMSAEQRALSVDMERAIDRAATSPDLRLRVLAAPWISMQQRITKPEVRFPTAKELADAAQGSTDPYVLAVMAAICRGAMVPGCSTTDFLHRWTAVAPQDARAWLNLAMWERSQGHEAASVQAFKKIATANELSDPQAMGLQIAISATKDGSSSSQDQLVLAAQASATASLVTLPLSGPTQWCGTDDTVALACRHLADLMLERGGLLDFGLALAIVDRLPATTPTERQRLATEKKAYFWALEIPTTCYLDRALNKLPESPDCPATDWLNRVAALGEVRYAKAELRRRNISVAAAAAAYDHDLAAAH
jgi:hypothetical protein